MITNRRPQEKFNSKNGVNRPPLYDLVVYCGGLSWRKLNMAKSKQLQKGEKFGRLTVLELDHVEQKNITRGKYKTIRTFEFYRFQCDCGNICVKEKNSVKSGNTRSCGCLSKEYNESEAHKKENLKHNLRYTRIYKIWLGIKNRCFNPKNYSYKNYSARGIKVCDEWKNNPKLFCNWAINNGYNDELTIDRIDVNDDYKPSNCRWITKSEQTKNKRNTIYLTYKNETKTLIEWSKEKKLNLKTLQSRTQRGWTPEKILETPIIPFKNRFITYKDKTQTVAEWAREVGMSKVTIRDRLNANWTIEEALTIPVGQKRKKKE